MTRKSRSSPTQPLLKVEIENPMNHDLSEYQDEEGFVLFGPVARSRLQEQCQYASRLITGRLDGYPALGADLRFKNLGSGSYHNIRIHADDVETFVGRYKAYEERRLNALRFPPERTET